jgi:hypothetical protein
MNTAVTARKAQSRAARPDIHIRRNTAQGRRYATANIGKIPLNSRNPAPPH